MHLPYKVLREVAEVVRPRHVRMTEQVCLRVLWLIAVTQKELEEVEEPQPFQPLVRALWALIRLAWEWT